MIIYLTSQFRKSYKKLPVFLKKKAKEKDEIFRRNPFAPALRAHKLKGKLANYWSYSVNINYRVLFRFIDKNSGIYFDVGTHQIYK
ncbi:MAG: type II toxin-antitoxin system RelE/ParE family toxin [Patescibacteria group bacterium]